MIYYYAYFFKKNNMNITKRLALIFIVCISCNGSDNNKKIIGSFVNSDELLLEPISIPITEEFESNYRYISFWDDEKVYFINEKRLAINFFDLKKGIAKIAPICDDFSANELFKGMIVNDGSIFLIQTKNIRELKLAKNNSCLNLVNSIPIFEPFRMRAGLNWPGNYALHEAISFASKELKRPSLLDRDLILPTYPMYMKEQKREHLFVKLNLDNDFLDPIKLPLPTEFDEFYEKYPYSEPYHILWNNKLVFHFMWSPEIFVYDFKTNKMTSHIVEGHNIKRNIKVFESEETNRIRLDNRKKNWSNYTQQFKDLIWLPEHQLFYRVEMKDKVNNKNNYSADVSGHYINVISKDFKPLYSFVVPEGAVPLPVPIGKKVYFQMVNEDNEDEIRFVAIDPMNIVKSK
jgi:hypothetical protein